MVRRVRNVLAGPTDLPVTVPTSNSLGRGGDICAQEMHECHDDAAAQLCCQGLASVEISACTYVREGCVKLHSGLGWDTIRIARSAKIGIRRPYLLPDAGCPLGPWGKDEVPDSRLTELIVTGEIAASAGRAWRAVRHWEGLARYASGVTHCSTTGEEPGAIRIVELADGRRFAERLLVADSTRMALEYEFVVAPESFPITDYSAEVGVEPMSTAGCAVTWRGRFRARSGSTQAEADAFVRTAYEANLEGLRRLLAGQ